MCRFLKFVAVGHVHPPATLDPVLLGILGSWVLKDRVLWKIEISSFENLH